MSNQMMVQQEVNSMMIIDGLKLDRVQDSMDKIQQFQKVIQSQLVLGHDHGAAFPGSTKTSLLKPGAEKILMLLGLTSEYEIIEKIQDYEEGFFAYTIKCVLTKGGQVITNGLGHCNSKEKKYDSDKQDKYMLGNTCLKMAKKRAQVDAALTVGSLSNIFTQDLEDMVEFNNNERIETMNSDDAENMKINFGKYKTKTLGEIHTEDPGYLDWVVKNARDEVVKRAAAMVLNPPNVKKDVSESVDTTTGQIYPTDTMPQSVLDDMDGYEDYPREDKDLPF